MSKKKFTGVLNACQCGGKGMVYEIGVGTWFCHCAGCGFIAFINSTQVFLRLKAGGKLCPHQIEFKPCKDGKTKTCFCSVCRTRFFRPVNGPE